MGEADPQTARSRPSLRTALLVAAALLLVGGLALCVTAPTPDKRPAVGAAPSVVDTLRVARQALRPRVRLAGVLDPKRRVELFAETAGRVLEVGAEELDRVQPGQVLLRIDPTLAAVALERGEAAVARARSQLELARLNRERRRSLHARDAVSDAQLDEAENAARIAAAALREARAQREEARDRLAKKTIAAPIGGVLRAFPVEVGEYVREGQQVGELLDLDAVRITVGLSDRQVVAVGAGAPAEVEVEALPGGRFAGRVLRVGAASDPGTRKFPVEVEVANEEGRLLPGMVARVTLDLGQSAPATLIPRDATLEEFGLRFVFVIESDTEGAVARRRRVEVRDVPFEPRLFEVTAGLAPGQEIAVSGLRQLRDGRRVARRGGTGS